MITLLICLLDCVYKKDFDAQYAIAFFLDMLLIAMGACLLEVALQCP